MKHFAHIYDTYVLVYVKTYLIAYKTSFKV